MYLHKIEQTNENDNLQHGNCEFLARELFNEFDYSTVFLVDYINDEREITREKLFGMDYQDYVDFNHDYYYRHPDEEVPYVNIVHCFGKAEIDGEIYYIDSTGIADNINDILKNFGFSLDKVDARDDMMIFELEDPHAIKDKFWSTYFDWYGDDDFEKETIEQRVKPSKEFVEDHREELDIDKVLSKTKMKDLDRER
jgi:hypothetical protein